MPRPDVARLARRSWRQITGAWRALHNWLPRTRELTAVWGHEVPDDVRRGTLYIAGEHGHLWCAVMQCPCECGALIWLSLTPDGRPRWKIIRHSSRTVSVMPSIRRTLGCRSHFFVRRGRVVWCVDRAPPGLED